MAITDQYIREKITILVIFIFILYPFSHASNQEMIDLSESEYYHTDGVGQFIKYWDEKLLIDDVPGLISSVYLVPNKPEVIICTSGQYTSYFEPHIAVYNTISGDVVIELSRCPFIISPDGKFFLSESSSGITVYSLTDYSIITTIDLTTSPDAVHMTSSGDHIYLMYADEDTVQRWSVETWSMEDQLEVERDIDDGEEYIFAWASDDSMFAVEVDCGFEIYSAPSFQLLHFEELDEINDWYGYCTTDSTDYLTFFGNDNYLHHIDYNIWNYYNTNLWNLEDTLQFPELTTESIMWVDPMYMVVSNEEPWEYHKLELLVLDAGFDRFKTGFLDSVENATILHLENRTGWNHADIVGVDHENGVVNTLYTYSFNRLYKWSLKTGWDWDYDNVVNEEDNCPNTFNSNQSNYDDDGYGDLCDDDDDGDGIDDDGDNCPHGSMNWKSDGRIDYDQDGCLDATEDRDDDGDGFEDGNDDCPYDYNYSVTPTGGCIDQRNTVILEELNSEPPTDLEQTLDTAASYAEGIFQAFSAGLNVMLIITIIALWISNSKLKKKNRSISAYLQSPAGVTPISKSPPISMVPPPPPPPTSTIRVPPPPPRQL